VYRRRVYLGGSIHRTDDVSSTKRYGSFTVAAPPPALPPPASAPATGVFAASYTFDSTDADATFDDGSGHQHVLHMRTRWGATLRTIAHGTGSAAQFPPECTGPACPRMVLQTPSAPDLNPGNQPMSFGATVRLAAGQTTDGQNILQKGYSAAGGQYKLQADKHAGRPSCAMTSAGDKTIHLAWSYVTIADGAWHTLECRRAGTSLTILVDGVIRGSATIPATLTVNNTAPLVLGGKGLGRNSDQYQGALDDVWIRIG
jgi:hypothetical protein